MTKLFRIYNIIRMLLLSLYFMVQATEVRVGFDRTKTTITNINGGDSI